MRAAFCASTLSLHKCVIYADRWHALRSGSRFVLGLSAKDASSRSLGYFTANHAFSYRLQESGCFPHHIGNTTFRRAYCRLDAKAPKELRTKEVKHAQTMLANGGQIETYQRHQEHRSIDDLRGSFDKLGPVERNGGAHLDTLIESCFPFPIDDFQKSALAALSVGNSVVLSAPTGAGKTIVGEMAVYLALCRRQRVFYTTPLKALSNQKYYDFKRQFGGERVGLLTGDVTVNREADVVVMTTEVYRNMLYADSTEERDVPPVTDDLFAVVFDEFHYLNDADRGTVWEESVINSPEHVILVALSATMSNTEDVRDWFAAVQGPTALVQSHVRPVPLSFAYCDHEGLTPLFEKRSRKRSDGADRIRGFAWKKRQASRESQEDLKLHPKLLRKLRESKEMRASDDRRKRENVADKQDDRRKLQDKYAEVTRSGRGRRRDRFIEVPSFPFVVRALRKRDMLPGIVFIFSRAGCDRAAHAAAQERESLVTTSEQEKIRERLDAFTAEHPAMVQEDRLDLALKGIASHHAGLLPLWKICVEELFQDGLIKVVFATETLAAGINMPARTTVISALSKRAGDKGFVTLSTNEVLQMAGRAGRRGKDVLGHSVVLKSRNEGAMDAFKILTRDVDALESKFSPNYGMVLNLLSARPLSDAKKLIDRSFGNFLRQRQQRSQRSGHQDNGDELDEDADVIEREREALERVLKDARDFINAVDEKQLRSYIKNIERVKAERRALTYLVKQGAEMDAELIEETLTFAPTGTKMLLRERNKAKSAGAERRQKRRDYSAAIAAAGNGDNGEELKSFYFETSDPELELLDKAGDEDLEDREIEAVLLDMHYESAGVLPTFAAVDANGALRMFTHTAVSQIMYEEDPIDVDVHADGWRHVSLPGRSLWQSIGYEQYSAPLPDCLDGLVEHLQSWRKERIRDGVMGNVLSRAMESHRPEILAQRERLRHAQEMVRSHELHNDANTQVLLAAKRAIPKIEATLDGRSDPFGNKRRQGKGGRYKRYLKRSKQSNGVAGGEAAVASNGSWDDFMSLTAVLQHYGFLDDSYGVTSLGSLAAKVRSENELWTSVVLMQPDLEHVSPLSLGAVLGATLMDTARNDVYVAQEVTEEVKKSVSQAAVERVRLHAVQSEFGVESPISLDAELMGLVELWASGVSWVELLSNTSLQEGDACRILRRVLDLLRQIQHLPVVGNGLKRNAKRAIALLDRFPVTDDRTYTVRADEKVDEEDE